MIALSLNAERGYVIISIKGAPGLEDYVDACQALASNENFYPETHRICDFSQIEDLSLSTTELLAFVEEARKLPKAANARTALIAKNAEDKGVMDAFSSHFERGTFKTFETGRDALAWVLWAAPETVARKDSDKIRYHRLSGDAYGEAAVRMQSAWFNDEEFNPGAPVLWDLRQATITTDKDELQLIANEMFAFANKGQRHGRAAILVRLKFQEAMLKEAFRKGIEAGRSRVFTSEKQAHEWLLESD